MAPADRSVRLGLVGSGPGLIAAIEILQPCAGTVITVVADASGEQSQAARLARGLGISVVTNPMDVFRTSANVILELNGEDRQYDRLLAVKPTGVEVLSARGARLLIDLLRQINGRPAHAQERPRVLVIVPTLQSKLYGYLKEGFADVRDVSVIVDDRRMERRQRARAQASERRRADRRTEPSLDEEFRSRGFAIRRQRAADPPR